MNRIILVALAFCGMLSAIPAPHRVLLVIDTNSQDSIIVGNYYRMKRTIPATNVLLVGINTADRIINEFKGANGFIRFTNDLAEPIYSAISNRGLSNVIDYIVLSYGIPVRMKMPGADIPSSTASYLATYEIFGNTIEYFYYEHSSADVANRAFACTNKYTAVIKNARPWPATKPPSYRLVSHLSAFETAEAMMALDSAVLGDGAQASVHGGRWVLQNNHYDRVPKEYGTNIATNWRVHYGLPSDWYSEGFNFKLNSINDMAVLLFAGVYSGYNNDNFAAVMPVPMAVPGGHAEADESFGCIPTQFLNHDGAGQFPMPFLSRLGFATYAGAVYEPGSGFLNACVSTNYAEKFRSMYMNGSTVIEASFLVSWRDKRGQTTFIGDPLSRPYAVIPSVTINAASGTVLQGVAPVSATASSARGIRKIELYIDGALRASADGASIQYVWDTRAVPDGEHTIYAVAYDASSILSPGSRTTLIVVANGVALPRPSVPRDITRTIISTERIVLSWIDTSLIEDGFIVYRSVENSGFVPIGTLGSNITQFTDTGLSTNVRYVYRVSAFNAAGESEKSAPLSVLMLLPKAPSALMFKDVTIRDIVLGWSGAGITNETGFNVYRSVNGGVFTRFTEPYPESKRDATSFNDNDISENSLHRYQVSATNEYGESERSLVIERMIIPIPVPTGLAASAQGASTILLSWTDNAVNETAYLIQRKTNGGNFVQVAHVPANTTSISDIVESMNNEYTYRIYGTNSTMRGEYSDSVSFIPGPPVAPSLLEFSASVYSVNENDGTAQISVTRSGGSAGTVSATYIIAAGTATAGGDFMAGTGTVSFSNGETTKIFSVTINDDAVVEGNETVTLTLSAPTGGAVIGTQNAALLTIVENDTPSGNLLMYDGFDYTLGASLHTLSGGTGWGENAWGSSENGSSMKSTVVEGLTFSDYQVSGNAVRLYTAGAVTLRIGRKIAAAATGDIWMSYLYHVDMAKPAAYQFSAIQTTSYQTAKGSEKMRNIAQIYKSTSGVNYGVGGIRVSSENDTQSPNSYPGIGTYLLIAKFTGIGGSGTQTGSWWALTPANYDAIKNNITEDALNANCLSKVSSSSAGAEFTASKYVQISLGNYASAAYTETIDELRYGTTLGDLFFGSAAITAGTAHVPAVAGYSTSAPAMIATNITSSSEFRITNAAAYPDAVRNSVRISYTVMKSWLGAAQISFAYSDSGMNTWTDMAVSGPTSNDSGSYSNEWMLPAGIDTKKRYDIRIIARYFSQTSAPAIAAGIDLSRFFSKKDDLSRAVAVNNPYRGNSEGIVFANLPANASVEVYSMSGRHLTSVPASAGANGRLTWNMRTSDGKKAAPGIYLCAIINGAERRTIKVMVLR
ncbi:MAG: Calx-beta domain-containing protein [Spirochaetota bacterium]